MKKIYLFFLYLIFPLIPLESNPISTLSFAVVGDIMNHELQIKTAYNKECNCWDYKFCFEKVKPYLESVDIAIGNLETTLPGDPNLYSGYPQFGAPDELLEALKWSGFDILTLANNHSVDKSLMGLIRTRKIVEEKGLIPLGTYYNEEHQKSNSIVLLEKNHIKLAFLNFTYGTNGLAVPYPARIDEIDLNYLRKQIAKAHKLQPDVIILLLHYGTEYQTEPDIYQRYIVNIVLKEGVDIVLGGHPHVVQPFELLQIQDKYGIKKERLVVWSLGNFVSNQLRINTDGGMIFLFKLNKIENKIFIRDLDYIPVYVDFNEKHYILPIHEYIYLNSIKEPQKFVYGNIKWNDQEYYIYFKNNNVTKKNQMVLFLQNIIKITNVMPKKLEIKKYD